MMAVLFCRRCSSEIPAFPNPKSSSALRTLPADMYMPYRCHALNGSFGQNLLPEFHQQGDPLSRRKGLILFPPIVILLMNVSDEYFFSMHLNESEIRSQVKR